MTRPNSNEDHRRFMAEAIELARKAEGRTQPNPMVGCVIVRDGEVVARGFHERAGAAHGEVVALDEFSGDTADTTLYVNLEPCSHFGRTPPCTNAIIEAGIPRVVVGTIDPDPRVMGSGLKQLEEAGVEVVTGVLEDVSQTLNAAYFKRTHTGLPLVVAKWAMSLDGKTATREGDSAWITSEASRELVHRMRDRYDAIMVGTGTVVADNPRLTCRVDDGRDPVRVILDARLRAPATSHVFDGSSSTADTLVFAALDAPQSRVEALEAAGVEVISGEVDESGRFRLESLLRELSERELMSVFVEGGGTLVGSLFDQGFVDRVHGFVAPKIIGGAAARTPVEGDGIAAMTDALKLSNVEVERIGEDLLVTGDVSTLEEMKS